MIKPGYKMNFETLKRAFTNGDVALVECTNKVTNKPVVALCAMSWDDEAGEYVIGPLAKMFDGDPYEELNPPA